MTDKQTARRGSDFNIFVGFYSLAAAPIGGGCQVFHVSMEITIVKFFIFLDWSMVQSRKIKALHFSSLMFVCGDMLTR